MTQELTRDQIINLISPSSKNSEHHDLAFANRVIDAMRDLTQRPAAQSEAQALAHNMMLWREDAVHNGNEYVPVHVRTLEKVVAQLRDMPAPQQATSHVETDWISNVIRDVSELPDRSSPDDEPDMMLVTAAELRSILETHAPQQATPEPWCPGVCPITGLAFFMWIEHHKTGRMVPTYGGPYDSYTIPVRDADGSYCRERYDHDRGGWLVDEFQDVGVQIVSDQAYVSDELPDTPEPVGEPWGWVCRYLVPSPIAGGDYWTDWSATKSNDVMPPKWSRGSYRLQEAVRVFTRPAPVETEPVAKVADLFHAVRDRLVAQGADLYDPLFIRPAPGEGRADMNSQEATAVRVIGRVGRILDTLIEKREPQRLRDVRHCTGLNESTCHRLLQDLVVLGLVKQIGMYYSLGPKWAQAAQKDTP